MKQAAKPYRNQRVSRPRQRRQQQLLEVSVRASKAREQRVRQAIGTTFKVLLLSALLAGAGVGGRRAIQTFFWENDAFYLTDVRFSSDGTLTREQVIQIAGLQMQRNIMLTDLAGARTALDKLPQVERVEVHRNLPNRIDIAIQERRPIAWVASEGNVDPSTLDQAYLVDARGYVIKSRKVRLEYLHLPIISGVETENIVAGQKVSTAEMKAALELLRLNADSTRWQIRSVDLRKGYCLVVTDRNRAEVTFGLDRVEGQLTRLYRLLEHLQRPEHDRGELRTVNLLVERNTPVTFHEPEPIEPPASPAEAAGRVAEPVQVAPPATPIVKPRVESKEKPKSSVAPAAKPRKPARSPEPSTKSKSSPSRKTPVDRLKRPFRVNG